MLFVIFVLILIAGIVWNFYDEWSPMPLITSSLALVGVLISLLFIGDAHIGVDGYVAQMNTRYKTLTYQYENDFYDNDNDLGKRELMVDIQSWNEDLAKYKEIQDDFWVGIYVADIYDQFEFIELDKEETK